MVINADSAQVYRDLRILSARPSDEEEAEAPHRLFGYRDGADPCSAADWATEARSEIAQAHGSNNLPILVGGTGLYLRTLMEGIAPVPAIDPEIRSAVRAMPVEQAFAALASEDPNMAETLIPTDTTRVARALEVIRTTGRSLREWRQERVGGIAAEVRLLPLILLPPREWLRDRCDRRFEVMMGKAGLEEARRLLARNLSADFPVMRAIGVPQVAAFLRGEVSKEVAISEGQAATRQYAKRQYTWFRRQPPESWARLEQPIDREEALQRALLLLGASGQMA